MSSVDVVKVADSMYEKVDLTKIQETYNHLKPHLFSAVTDNKIEFIDFIADICLNQSLSTYTNDVAVLKWLVERADSLQPQHLEHALEIGLKHFCYIDFLKQIKHPIIIKYKSSIVEPLIKSCTRLVVKLAKEVKLSVPFEDRVMLGLEGLIVASWRFEPYKGFQFTTYARNWIRQRMFSEIDTGLKISRQQMMKFHNLYPLYNEYKQLYDSGDITGFVDWLKHEKKIPDSELLSPDTIKTIISASSMISYESLAEEYENRTSDDFIASSYSITEDKSFEDFVENFENKEYLEKFEKIAKQVLTDLEFKVFTLLVFSQYKREQVRVMLKLKKLYDVDKLYKKAVNKLKALFPDKQSLIYLKPSTKSVNVVESLL